jgi:hypothetical protein
MRKPGSSRRIESMGIGCRISLCTRESITHPPLIPPPHQRGRERKDPARANCSRGMLTTESRGLIPKVAASLLKGAKPDLQNRVFLESWIANSSKSFYRLSARGRIIRQTSEI